MLLELRLHLLIQFLYVFQQKTKDEITRLERDVDGRNYIDCYFETRKIIECRLREYLLWDREGAKKRTEEDDQGHAPNTKVFPVSDFIGPLPTQTSSCPRGRREMESRRDSAELLHHLPIVMR